MILYLFSIFGGLIIKLVSLVLIMSYFYGSNAIEEIDDDIYDANYVE